MTTIAISYRRSDSAGMTGRIAERLAEHFGADNVFIDIDAIPYGIDFRDHIATVLASADAVLVMIGPRWLGETSRGRRIDDPNDPVRIEVKTALAQNVPVIPVLVDDAVMPAPELLPEELRDFAYRNAAEIDVGRDFRVHVDRLIRSLEKIGEGLAPAADLPAPQAARGPAVPPTPPTDGRSSHEAFGGYARTLAETYEGHYHLYRWSFSRAGAVFRAVVEISWDAAKGRLIFLEHYESGRDGPADVKSHAGDVYLSPYTSLVHLTTVFLGSVRTMTLTQMKLRDRIMRGLMLTQSDTVSSFQPTVSTVVLRKVRDFDPATLPATIDLVPPGTEDHAFALEQLTLTEREVVRLRFGGSPEAR